MDAKAVAELLLDAKVLTFNVKEPYTFASGIKSPVYMDCRLLISDVKRRGQIVDALVRKFDGLECDIVAATASAGIPWGAWVADRLEKPLVYVRKEAKAHGKGKKVEGAFIKGLNAVVVEDLVSTGGSSISTVESLREEDSVVEYCVSIFTYGMQKAAESFDKANVELHPLSNFNTAVEAAIEKKYLTPAEAAEARKWAKDPQRWRK